MDKVRLRYLLARHIADTISPVELEELFVLIENTDIETQEEILTNILEEKSLEHRLPTENRQLLYEKIRQTVLKDQSEEPTYRSATLKKYISVAAVLIVGMSALFWLWKSSQLDVDHIKDTSREMAGESDDIYITPDNVPFLRLPNGEIQTLEGDQLNALTETGVKITLGKDGEIIYEVQHVADEGLSQQENIVFTTPKGQSSKILLIDGTEVWLNSGSSLTYPKVFSNKERKVKLVGEGYFDVAHHAEKPFYVETDKGPLIRVLGTSFNVSAYPDDSRTTTTLVEGSVQLMGKHHNVVLKPSEQVIANESDQMLHKNRVHVDDFISWKNGYFSFNEQSVQEILAKVQRWYNIEHITYDYLPDEKFTGTFKRTKSLRSLLLKLEKISNVKFQIKERRVVVTK